MFKNTSIEKILAWFSVFVLFSIVGLIAYESTKNDVTVMIKLQQTQDPFVAIPKIMPEEAIQTVRQNDRDRNEYRVTVRTRKHGKELLERILKNDSVEEAVIP